MRSGWIKLHRQFFDHPFWKEDRQLSKAEAWIDLCVKAQIEASTVFIKGKGIDVQRGQLIASERYLCERWSWSRGKVRNFFSYMEKSGMITSKCTKGETIRTLVKYDVYQGIKPSKKPAKSTTESPPKDQIEEEKEIKKFSLKNAYGEIRSIETPKDFLEMWNAYVRHYDKILSNRNILDTTNKSNLQELKKHFGINDFVTALNGLFKSSAYRYCRTSPTHFLNPEHFQNYLTAGQSGTKLFEDKNRKTEKI